MQVRYGRDASQQTLSYKYVISEGNYTAVSITAVDLCGQRSKSSQVKLSNIEIPLIQGIIATNTTTCSTIPTSDSVDSDKQGTIDILAGVLALTIAMIIAISIIFIAILICIVRRNRGGADIPPDRELHNVRNRR